MRLPFTKMHGAGNDFVFLNALAHTLPSDLSALSQQVCHRRFGVGADQMLIVARSESADFRMEIFNADGGRVEMCGNGIRCFAKYVRDQKLTDKTELSIETLAGIIKPSIITNHPRQTPQTAWVKVDMGEPILDAAKVPTRATGKLINHTFAPVALQNLTDGTPKEFRITTVSMGNPHCVIFVDNLQKFPVERVGSAIETDPFFPNRTNVEFVEVRNRRALIQRTWERGAGETYACGTGACAVIVAAVLTGVAERSATISLKGGDLDLSWDEASNRVFKTGPGTTVFEGMLDL
jgi:diaminopimelate epimerase